MSNLTGICQLQGKEIPIQKSILKIGHVGNHSKAVWLLAWHPIKPIAETEHPIAPNLWLRSWLLLSLMTWINTCVLAVITLNSNLQNNKKKESITVSLVSNGCVLCLCLHCYFIRLGHTHQFSLFNFKPAGDAWKTLDQSQSCPLHPQTLHSHNTSMSISWLLNI